MVLAALCVLVTGCRSDDPGASATSPAPGVAAPAPGEPEVRSRVTRVLGDLSAAQRRLMAGRARTLVAEYVEAAFVDRRRGDRAFPGFTPGARRLAREDRRLLTGGAFEGPVTTQAATAWVTVWAHEGRPAGATARVAVDLEVEGRPRVVRLEGRLLLTPTPSGWRVFGYDLTRGPGPEVAA